MGSAAQFKLLIRHTEYKLTVPHHLLVSGITEGFLSSSSRRASATQRYTAMFITDEQVKLETTTGEILRVSPAAYYPHIPTDDLYIL